ncbi:MAG TPA: hypothetical protein VHW00_13160 [Thermoanaerobaculia bacterium]|nr:hypothetical protein [Thermoanaerobaculia bacterium]
MICATGEAKDAAARIGGELRTLDPTGTHMGCTVAWNAAEKLGLSLPRLALQHARRLLSLH